MGDGRVLSCSIAQDGEAIETGPAWSGSFVLWGDGGALFAVGGDGAFAFEFFVGPGDGPVGESEVAGELPDGWQLRSGGQRTGEDEAGDLASDLFVVRGGASRVYSDLDHQWELFPVAAGSGTSG